MCEGKHRRKQENKYKSRVSQMPCGRKKREVTCSRVGAGDASINCELGSSLHVIQCPPVSASSTLPSTSQQAPSAPLSHRLIFTQAEEGGGGTHVHTEEERRCSDGGRKKEKEERRDDGERIFNSWLGCPAHRRLFSGKRPFLDLQLGNV